MNGQTSSQRQFKNCVSYVQGLWGIFKSADAKRHHETKHTPFEHLLTSEMKSQTNDLRSQYKTVIHCPTVMSTERRIELKQVILITTDKVPAHILYVSFQKMRIIQYCGVYDWHHFPPEWTDLKAAGKFSSQKSKYFILRCTFMPLSLQSRVNIYVLWEDELFIIHPVQFKIW